MRGQVHEMAKNSSVFMQQWERDKETLATIVGKYTMLGAQQQAQVPIEIGQQEIERDNMLLEHITARYQSSQSSSRGSGNPYLARIVARAVETVEQMQQRIQREVGKIETGAPAQQPVQQPMIADTVEARSAPVPNDNVVNLVDYKHQRDTGVKKGQQPAQKKQSQPTRTLPTLTSENAREEFKRVQAMHGEFDHALEDIITRRLKQTMEFGKTVDVNSLAAYLKHTCGGQLYHDALLSMTQQYALADVPIVNASGKHIGKTGFNLAFFGAPGTGKTFAINELIRGNEKIGIPAHGLVGRNRYCASMSAVQFIKMGEAYQGREFNFIVPEFENWFRYSGMADVIKLAMEGGEIAHETDRGRIGPYRFSSFFSVNYNVAEKINQAGKNGNHGYATLQQNPNFQAVEDRMLATLHEQTPERYRAVAENMERIALGEVVFDGAQQIQDHLMLVYAIQTEHPLVSARFAKKDVVVDSTFYEKLRGVREALFAEMDDGSVPFSSRLERRTLQLAAGMSMIGYFGNGEVGNATPRIEISQPAREYALQFFVSEAASRSGKDIDTNRVMETAGINAANREE